MGGVLRHAVHEAGACGIAILDDGSPEARLAADWAARALGVDAVARVEPPDPAACLAAVRAPTTLDRARGAEEALRFHARIVSAAAGFIPAHPANKTSLLLARAVPPEPLLPMGDLYASQIRELAGECTVPPHVHELADRAGGLDRLDAILGALVDERRGSAALPSTLDGPIVAAVRHALEAGRWARRRIGLVPKLGLRTPGIDLLD